ncbi:neural-cadherin-like isoform X3 [Zootermopsis nevadensis]|uniref:Neural-cadherin n=1 Tax=Zootermopsis nevadensis TaxID=136037 RepID=A0A067R647_ZOONE|nr:neural-cadherin-like isoform X3 [Zootermopsis nevadensis]KDR14823.1 Neural-cadherin [Zootermopsis nevadensis]
MEDLALVLLVAVVTLLNPEGMSAGGLAIRRSIAVIPHDIYPGYSIKKFEGSQQLMNYRLLETGFSEFFTVLEDGLVMTTSDLSPLVNRPVNLVVLEETPNSTATHTLQLYVLDRRDMLAFQKDLYEGGEVPENSPAGTTVEGIPRLEASGGGVGGLPVRYAIVAGNEDGSFALQERVNGDNETLSGTSKMGLDGVRLVTARPLDRETTSSYTLTVQAADGRGIDKAVTKVKVTILDENDNSPVFSKHVYRFNLGDCKSGSEDNGTVTNTWKRLAAIGTVSATDADGDRVAYRLAVPSNLVVIVPQTGDLLLAGDPPSALGEDVEYEITVDAHDLRIPSRSSEVPAQVWLQFSSLAQDDGHLQNLDKDPPQAHRISKRRVTRAVRPTKKIEFTEADGETEGRVVFQLEKETERETFKIRDENPWVTVEPNGAVRVKKKWDYEELGPEKTIDFWVSITNAGLGTGGTIRGPRLRNAAINTP